MNHAPRSEIWSRVSVFVIAPKGVSAAIDYLNLKEAKRTGKRAEIIAICAIIIGVIVGLVQIYVY